MRGGQERKERSLGHSPELPRGPSVVGARSVVPGLGGQGMRVMESEVSLDWVVSSRTA